MAFVKLDTGILDSTLWVEKDQRDVFLTALLMAEPRQFDEPQAQIEVDSMELTGFMAPPGWYGFCPAAGPGIVRRALADQDLGMRALRALGAPDAESRTKLFDGRRMIRINGGYLILNYMLYRDRDYAAADRMRALRERRRQSVTANTRNTYMNNGSSASTVTANTRNVTPNVTPVRANMRNAVTESDAVRANVTQAEAEAEIKAKQSKSLCASPARLDAENPEGAELWPGICAETDPFPEGLNETQYGWHVLTRGRIPNEAPALRRSAGSAVGMLARELGCGLAGAASEMLSAVREAQADGVQKWLLWFQNGEWRKSARFHLEEQRP